MAAMVRDPFGALPALARRYGDVVRVPFPGATVTLLSHPDHIEHVLVKNSGRYRKHPLTHVLVDGQALALPLTEDEQWRCVRLAVSPRMSDGQLAELSPGVAATATAHIDEWGRWADTGEYVDLTHLLGVAAMAALMQTLFEIPLEHDTIDAAVETIDAYGAHVVRLTATSWLPRRLTRHVPGLKPDATQRLRDLVEYLIDYRISHPIERGGADFISTLLGVRHPDGTGLTRDQLCSEVMGLVFAGFDTTALACAWVVGLLAQHPREQARVYAEVDALGGGLVTYHDLQRLPFLRNCFDEAQRLQAVPAWPRYVAEDDDIGGYHIRAGSTVLFSPYGLQRDPRFWRNPDVFDPDRFSPDRKAVEPIERYAFLPFNAGPRKCAGSKMAYVEGLILLATTYQRYRFETKPGWTPRNRAQTATGLKDGLPVTISRRALLVQEK